MTSNGHGKTGALPIDVARGVNRWPSRLRQAILVRQRQSAAGGGNKRCGDD